MVQGMGLGDNSPKKKKSELKTKDAKKKSPQKTKQVKTRTQKQSKQKSSPRKPQGDKNNKNNVGKIVIAFIVGVIVLLGVFIGYSYFSGSSQDAETSLEDVYSNIPEHESSTDEDLIRSTAADHIMHNPFSKIGLYEQMLSEGFNHEISSRVIDELDVDWAEQAMYAGVRYVQYTAPEAKESGLRDQLLYEGFTEDEVDNVVDELNLEELNQEFGPTDEEVGEPEIPESDKE